MTEHPKVFISHASEDKERFVTKFYERLRVKGIDAWLDKFEMLPGDSLVDKIFNEGLKPADAMVVVLSNTSITKPWVQKELSLALVRNIVDKKRLIPMRLDACEVPECLRDTLWQDIPDLQNYDEQLERIVAAIHGQYDKPPLGSRPAYTHLEVLQIDDLARNDSLFLAAACKIAMEQGHPGIDPDPLVEALKKLGISDQDMLDAQEVLANRYYIKTHPTIGRPHVYHFDITTSGFESFAQSGGIPAYGKKITDVARLLVEIVALSGGMASNTSVEAELELPPMLVEHIFKRLRDSGLIKYDTEIGGRLFMTVYRVSPELRRRLEGNG